MCEGGDYVEDGEEEGGDGPAEVAFDASEKQEDAAEIDKYLEPDQKLYISSYTSHHS